MFSSVLHSMQVNRLAFGIAGHAYESQNVRTNVNILQWNLPVGRSLQSHPMFWHGSHRHCQGSSTDQFALFQDGFHNKKQKSIRNSSEMVKFATHAHVKKRNGPIANTHARTRQKTPLPSTTIKRPENVWTMNSLGTQCFVQATLAFQAFPTFTQNCFCVWREIRYCLCTLWTGLLSHLARSIVRVLLQTPAMGSDSQIRMETTSPIPSLVSCYVRPVHTCDHVYKFDSETKCRNWKTYSGQIALKSLAIFVCRPLLCDGSSFDCCDANYDSQDNGNDAF